MKKFKKKFKLSELAKYISGRLIGEDLEVRGLNAISLAKEGDLIFVDSLARLEQARQSNARACVAKVGLAERLPCSGIIEVEDVRLALAKLSALFVEEKGKTGISPQAYVDETAKISKDALIMAFAYVGARAKIGARVVIYPYCYVGEDCEIGEGTILYPRVTLYPGTIIGKRCIIHAGAVIGADGFGFAQEKTAEGFKNVKIYHFGRVKIEDEVEIGANTCIDRATFGETFIGEGTKIDNLVQVGHNVRIGRHCILVAQVGLGGSVELGDNTMLGGQVGVAPASKIGRLAKVAAKSGVSGKVEEGEEVAGIPAIKASLWRKVVVILAKLPELYQKLKSLP